MRKRWPLALTVMLALAGCGSPPQSHGPNQAHAAKKQHATQAPQATQSHALYSAVAVSIDNQAGAWPQSGLSRASLVFEFMAEGGITRYLAVFWTHGAAKIGPVRSTRIYFDNVAAAYSWPLAHAGGNVDALKAIGPLGIKNLDQIYGSAQWFWRSSGRLPPHNLYTSTNLLEQGIRQDKYQPAGIPAFASGKLKGQPTRSTLIDYTPGAYTVGWVYQGNGIYQRQINGQNVETQAGNPVRAANIAIIWAPMFADPDPYTPGAVNFNLTNGGSGYIMSAGVRQGITWTFGQGGFRFYLKGGKQAPFAQGQTWVEVLPAGTSATFQPGS